MATGLDLPAWLDAAVAPDFDRSYHPRPGAGELDPVFARDPDEARPAIVSLYEQLSRMAGRHSPGYLHLYGTRTDQVLQRAARRKWGWTVEELLRLWTALDSYLRRYRNDQAELLRLPLAVAEQLRPTAPEAVASLIEPLVPRLDRLMIDTRQHQRLLALHAPDDGPLPTVLAGQDPMSRALRSAVGDRLSEPGVAELLRHVSSYPTGVRPSARWRRTAADLLGHEPAAAVTVDLLEVLRTQDEQLTEVVGWGHRHLERVYAVPELVPVVRGTVWAAGVLAAGTPDPGLRARLLAALTDTAVGCAVIRADGEMGEMRSMPTVTSAVAAIGELDGEAPVTALLRLRRALRHRVVLQQVDKALVAVATRAGLTLDQLEERSVPQHGLEPGGRSEVTLGDVTAVLTVTERPLAVTASWFGADGRALRSVPAAVRTDHAEALADLRTRAKGATAVLGSERQRIEGLLATERSWSVAEWRGWYAEHPLTGTLTRGLLWSAGDATGFPVPDPEAPAEWSLVDVRGRRTPLAPEARIALWHPLHAGPEEIRGWRDLLAEQARWQPFKQVFREVYLLTPAEEATRVYSNRFAAHVLSYRPLRGLLKTRGWTGGSLGYWDDGFDAEATREISGWRARFSLQLVESADDGELPRLCATDQVRFERVTDAGAWELAPVAEVPARVFSEAMRDVDLFVGVTSIAADPEWVDRGEDPHQAYWRTTTFGELTESAEVRRDALLRLMPRTRIADRVEVGERFLTVRGDLRTYRIHLGSGNILMSPNDEYLCIVPTPGRTRDSVLLPFEEGGGLLSTIASKAFLLAADTAIEDRTILEQIRR